MTWRHDRRLEYTLIKPTGCPTIRGHLRRRRYDGNRESGVRFGIGEGNGQASISNDLQPHGSGAESREGHGILGPGVDRLRGSGLSVGRQGLRGADPRAGRAGRAEAGDGGPPRGDFRGPGAPAGGADHRPRQGGRGADPRAHGAADGADGGGQSRTKPFRLARLSVKPDPDDLQRLCRTRVEEIEGFVEGLFGDEESVDVPESASEALDHLAEINASMHGCLDLMQQVPAPTGSEETLAVTVKLLKELSRTAEKELQTVVLSCNRARRLAVCRTLGRFSVRISP